jgi:acetyl-CoA synthetase
VAEVWTPDERTLAHANVTRLQRRLGISDYRELVRRAADDPEWFWPEVIDDLGLEFFQRWDTVVDVSRSPEWATWFLGGKLNIAWNCVHRWAERSPEGLAAVGLDEDGVRRDLTFAEMSDQVTRLAEALVRLGVEPGDRVAILLPMSTEVPIASHACAHVGPVQGPMFSGFAAPAVAQRLQDSEAKVAITTEVSVAPRRRGADARGARGGEADGPRARARDRSPLSVAREVAYQADAHVDDVLHFATDMGWIMGPWTVVGGGATGCTLVFTEGAPDFPPDRLWRLVEAERVTILGCSPTLVRALIPHGEPDADLSSLRVIVTTREPWNPDPYRWLFERVGVGRCPIINCSGGTEVGACFLSPTPAAPIKACSVGGPALGMAMNVVDEEGRSLAGTGEVGELVCRKPFPAMTRGFWRDPERYLDSYWRRFPGVWTHGDWASVDEDGFWFLHGRSDDTLNIAGKRVGPAEIESAAVSHPAVSEAAAVGVPHEVKGEVAWVFGVLAPGAEAREQDVRERVAAELGKAFSPDRVLFMPALPKTRSAKIVRRAVRATALGQDPGDMSSVENPEALEAIAGAV